MQKLSDNGLEFIKSFEGFSAVPYLCPARVWTIGYGSTKGVTKDTPPMTQQEASELIAQEVVRYENSVRRLITVPLTQNEYDALVSFTYNLGGGVLQYSTLRMKINRSEKKEAAKEFLKWVYSAKVKSKGLMRRRLSEMELFLA